MNVHQRPDQAAEKATKKAEKNKQPPQEQDHQPGVESEMRPAPQYMPKYPGVDAERKWKDINGIVFDVSEHDWTQYKGR